MSDVKIIQIMGMTNDQHWQGHTLGLGDDGVVYIDSRSGNFDGWEVYIPLEFTPQAKPLPKRTTHDGIDEMCEDLEKHANKLRSKV